MRIVMLVLAALALAVAAPAVADKGGNDKSNGGNVETQGNNNGGGNANGKGDGETGGTGPLEATIALAGAYVASSTGPVVSGDVTFAVTRSKPSDEVLWVTNKCYDTSGVLVTRTDTATLWGTTESLVGTAGPMPTGGVSCTAYVTLRPWQDRPLKDAVIEYDVE